MSHHPVAVRGVHVKRLPVVADRRGVLMFAEVGAHLPFVPQRIFALYDVGDGMIRGDHAHRECHQFIVCYGDGCTLTVDDGHQREEIQLDSPSTGVHLMPLTWCIVRPQSPATVVLVLTSHPYDAADYVRDYAEFKRLTSAPHESPLHDPA